MKQKTRFGTIEFNSQDKVRLEDKIFNIKDLE